MIGRPVFAPGRAPREALDLTSRQATRGAAAWNAFLLTTGRNAILCLTAPQPVVRLEQTPQGVYAELGPMVAVVEGAFLDLGATPRSARRRMLPGMGTRHGPLPLRLVTETQLVDTGPEGGAFHLEVEAWHLEVGPGRGLSLAMLHRDGADVSIDEAFLPPTTRLASLPGLAPMIRAHLQPLLDAGARAETGLLRGLFAEAWPLQRLAMFQDAVEAVLVRTSAPPAEAFRHLELDLSTLARVLGHDRGTVPTGETDALYRLADILPLGGVEATALQTLDAQKRLTEATTAPAEVHGPDAAGRSEVVGTFPASVLDVVGTAERPLRIEVRGLRAPQGATAAVHPWHRPEQLHSALSHVALDHSGDGFSVSIDTCRDAAPACDAHREILASNRVRLVLPLVPGPAQSGSPSILLSRS